MEGRDKNELQLLEVSQRVRKLTRMIYSFSKAQSLSARPKYITEDLLRDSLALQDSLVTIRRLQETSRMMSSMEQKFEIDFTKERWVDGEDKNVKKCGSLPGVDLYDVVIWSLSANVSSRNCASELNSAIKAKTDNKNLDPVSSDLDIAPLNRSAKFPTRSSIGLMENSTGATNQTIRTKGPNLIAKLIGVEKIPSQVIQLVEKNAKHASVYKQTLGFEKSKIQSRLTSDVQKSHVNESEARTIEIMKPQHLALFHKSKGKKQIKKENMVAELSLKMEISGHEHMLNSKRATKRMDKVSVELFPKFRTPTASITLAQKKAPEEGRGTQVKSVPLVRRVKEPRAKSDKKHLIAKDTVQAICIQPSSSRKSFFTSNAKPISKHSTAYLVVNKNNGVRMSERSKSIKILTTRCKGVGKGTKPINKAGDLRDSLSTSSIHGSSQQLAKDSKVCLGESTRQGSKSFCAVMPKGSKCIKQRLSVTRAAVPRYDKTITFKEPVGPPKKDVKLLLLSSPNFLIEVRKLYGFDGHTDITMPSYQNGSFNELGARNVCELVLGCAKELMARKRYQLDLFKHHPMWATRQKSSSTKVLISVEQLVEDISDGIKELSGSYRATNHEDIPFLTLERDLRSKDMFLNASWDFGWIFIEFGPVVELVVDLIICGLVGEVVFLIGSL